MDTLDYRYEKTVILVEQHVIEVFRLGVAGSLRTPLGWAIAQLEGKKGDRLHVTVGATDPPGGPFYGRAIYSSGALNFDIPVSEEARLRAFLDQAAQRAGRPTS